MPIFHFSNYQFDDRALRLGRKEELIELRPQVAMILRLLVNNPDEILSKETLIEKVWGEIHVSEQALFQCMNELRKSLGDDSRNPKFIKTIPRIGYQWVYRDVKIEKTQQLSVVKPQKPASRIKPWLFLFFIVIPLLGVWHFMRSEPDLIVSWQDTDPALGSPLETQLNHAFPDSNLQFKQDGNSGFLISLKQTEEGYQGHYQISGQSIALYAPNRPFLIKLLTWEIQQLLHPAPPLTSPLGKGLLAYLKGQKDQAQPLLQNSWASELFETAKNHPFTKGLHLLNGGYDKQAIPVFQEALKAFSQTDGEEGRVLIPFIHLYLSECYRHLENDLKASEHVNKGFESSQFRSQLALAVFQMGQINLGKGDPKQSIPLFQMAMELGKVSQSPLLECKGLLGVADAYNQFGDLVKAESFLKNLKECADVHHQPRLTMKYHYATGFLKLEQMEKDQSLQHFKKALHIADDLQDMSYLALVNLALTTPFDLNDKSPELRGYFESAEHYSNEIDNPPIKRMITMDYAEYCLNHQRTKKAGDLISEYESITQEPGPDYYYEKARLLFQNGDVAGALAMQLEAKQKAPWLWDDIETERLEKFKKLVETK